MKRFASYVLAVALAAGLVPLATADLAGAVPAAPVLSAPADLANVTSNPVLSWDAVTGATSYVVQASVSSTFSPLLVNKTTVNTKYGPESDLPLGVIYWRVAAKDGGGQGGYSDVRSFTKDAPSGPTLSSPADSATLEFPTDPPVFSWDTFPGAKRYEIEIDSDPSFVAPLVLSATSTYNTSYTLTAPPTIGQNFYWRVRAFTAGNLPSQYSDTRSYSYDWPDVPVLQTPPNDNSPGNAVEQVVFGWTATPGAVSYELQVSPSDQFTSLTVNVSTVKGTRYSPPNTIDNGAYFWRVRARNYAGAVGTWSDVSTFYRAWPAPDSPPNHRVTLLTPANNDVSVGLPEFSWTPVRLASQYVLEIGPDPLFSPSSFDSCTTQHTSFIPVAGCDLDPGTDYYWRVKPIDGPSNVNGLYSSTFRLQYDPGIPPLLSPPNGATGLVAPVELTWGPISIDGGAQVAKYKVTILDNASNTVETATTFATGYVPQNLDPGDGPFRWFVQIDTESGDGNIPGSGSHRTFSFAAPTVFSSTPDPITPNGTTGYRVPHLEWDPVDTATSYEIWRATVPSVVYSLYKSGIKVSGYTDTASSVAGSFTYFIRAKDGSSTLADSSTFGSFTVQTLGATQLVAPAHCLPNTSCAVEPNTPTFEWQWDPKATHYRIYLASDPNFTNILSGYNGVKVHYPRYRPTVSLPDAQAGQATYWYARPCYGTSPEVCGAEAGTFEGANPPVRAFTKRSNQVSLVSPANQDPEDAPLAANANQIVFTWTDFLATNLAAPGDLATSLEARNYRVQISTTADMQTIVHTSPFVDQTTYTLYSATLPDGPLYWRVQPFDASGNALSFSEVRLVHKSSPLVSLATPSAGADVTSVPLFTWASQPFAGRYSLEVYKNVDQPLASGNRVLSVTTAMTGWIPTTSLPAGDYGWRVRRLDADGRVGPWSASTNADLRLFTVAGNQVSLLTPTGGSNFEDNNQSFTWTAAPGAAQYRFQSSTASDFSSTKESVITVMTSWHSVIAYPNGSYYWRVQTIDGSGNVTATSAVRTFTHGPPPPPSVYYHPLTPGRILDSRPAPFTVGPYSTKWGPDVSRPVTVAGFSGVPAGADAVTLNVTVTGTTAGSFLQIWPKDQPAPQASAINWSAGATLANAVTVTVGADEAVTIRNQAGSTNVIVDVVGYYDGNSVTGGGFTSLTPSRILDSRPAPFTVGPYSTKWGPGGVRSVQVAGGTTGVPAGADAVVLNVTATGATAGSFLTIWPDGTSQPTASSLNFNAGQTLPNAVTAKVGSGGNVKIFNNAGSVNVIVDVVGYFDQGSGVPFRPLPNPVRIQDSRSAFKVGPYSTPWGAGTTRDVTVVGALANIPQTATAALLNVTVTSTTGSSFLIVWPFGAAQPNTSSLNWSAGQAVANSVTAKLGGSPGKIKVFNQAGQTHVIMDVSGYYGA